MTTNLTPRMKEHLSDAMERPDSFHDRSGLSWDTWGCGIVTHRDADSVTRSNWDVISSDMLERFPDDVIEQHTRHAMCGWMDMLRVRFFDDVTDAITPAGFAMLEWLERLDAYPVADDDHHSELEHTEFLEYFEDGGFGFIDSEEMWDVIESLEANGISRRDDVDPYAVEEMLHQMRAFAVHEWFRTEQPHHRLEGGDLWDVLDELRESGGYDLRDILEEATSPLLEWAPLLEALEATGIRAVYCDPHQIEMTLEG